MLKINKFIKIKNFLSCFLLCILVLYLNFGTTLIAMRKIDYFAFSRGLQFIAIPCFVFYIVHKLTCERKIKIYDICIFLLSFLLFLSYLFAFNQMVALQGELNRNEGLLTLFSYYSFFLLSTTIKAKDRKKIIFIFLLSCIYQIVLGIIQTMKIPVVLGYNRSGNWSTFFSMASGTHGNPNFYSTYILLGLLCVYSKFLNVEHVRVKIGYLFLVTFFFFGLLIGNTLSCILAFCLIVIVTFLIKMIQQKEKKIVFFLIGGIFFLILPIKFVDSYSHGRVSKMISVGIKEISLILTGNIDEDTGNGRIYVWREALSKSGEYWVFGIGVDNFSYLNDGRYIGTQVGKSFQYFDKAHNEYIQIFITEGIFTLLVYLFLIGYILYKGNKKKMVFLACIGYLVQAFFNISVINVAPVFYVFLGFLAHTENVGINNQKRNILFIVSKLNNGGAERVITNLSNYYHEHNKEGSVIVVVGKNENADYKSNAKVIEIQELLNKHHRLKAILKLRKIKKKYAITTSISFLMVPDILNYYSKVNEKVIISNRNYVSKARTVSNQDFRQKMVLKLHTRVKRKSDLIINCSEAVEQDQIDSYHINPKKMIVIPNFVNIENIEKQSLESIDERVKYLFDENTILVVGRFHPQKGIPYIIRAFNEVIKQNKYAKLVIMGRGDEEKIYKQFIKHYHLENSVFLFPFDSNPYKYMKKSGMLVSNSVHEGMPNVVLEAMACGLPVIATDCYGGSSEIITGDFLLERTNKLVKAKYGILVPPPILNSYSYERKLTINEKGLQEAITLLLQHPKEKEHYKKVSKERVQDYRLEKIIQEWDKQII